MHKFIFLLLFLGYSGIAFAQKSLLFVHAQSGKTIEMKIGHRATILYKGYLGQIEVAKETVTDITDSTIVLGVNLAETFPALASKPGKNNRLIYKIIKVTDIVGFRRMTIGRQVAKITLTAATVVGSFYIAKYAYASNLSSIGALGVTIGAGLGLLGLNHLILPEGIQYYFEEGWSVKVLSKEMALKK